MFEIKATNDANTHRVIQSALTIPVAILLLGISLPHPSTIRRIKVHEHVFPTLVIGRHPAERLVFATAPFAVYILVIVKGLTS